MKEFVDSISNRETAILVWTAVFFGWTLSVKSLRRSILDVFRAFIVWKIASVFGAFLIYAALLALTFYKAGFWNLGLLKDTLVWGLGTAAIMLFRSVGAKNWSYFKDVIKDTLKWTIILEFVSDFYTFSLPTELILVPVLVFIGMLIAYADAFKDKFTGDQQRVGPLLKNLLSIIGFVLFGFVTYKTITKTNDLLTTENLKSFLLPVFFTLLFLPFVYAVALVSAYENLWIRLDFLTSHNHYLTRKLKWSIFKVANLSLTKLSNISENISKPTLIYNDFSLAMIKEISKRKYKGFDEEFEEGI